MEIQSKIHKIILFIVVNAILLIILYNIPILENTVLENLCLYKNLFNVECWNCGMTRAFLSILHGEFEMAIGYNFACIFVFPIVALLYLYSWQKFIIKNNN